MTTQASAERARVVHDRAVIVNALGNLLRMPSRGNLGFPLPSIMREGGVTAVSLTVAVTEDYATTSNTLGSLLEAIDVSVPGARVARTAEDIRLSKRDGSAAIILNFQGSEPIDGSLEKLQLFHRLGLRVLQLTYQRRNLAGDGCGEPADAGLSIFGRELVQECNRLGILIDLSHVGYRSTMEAIELSDDPVAFTHVNVHALNPIPRNKTDEQIRAVAERGGVIGINGIARLLSPRGGERGATIEEYLDQVDHVVQLVGIDHVGLGFDVNEDMTADDFEERRKGFLTQFPELRAGGDFPFEHYYVNGLTMRNVLPLTSGLVDRGYSDEDIEKVLGGNFLRLYEMVWQ